MLVVAAGASYEVVPENMLGAVVSPFKAKSLDLRPPLANDRFRTERPFARVIER